MKFGKFEIDEIVVIMLLFVILILGAALLGYKLDSQDKEIEQLKLGLQIEQEKNLKS